MNIKKRAFLSLIAAVLVAAHLAGAAPPQRKAWLQIVKRTERGGDWLLARNDSLADVTVILEVSGSAIGTSLPVPLKSVVSGRSQIQLLRVFGTGRSPWRYRYQFRYFFGNAFARHDSRTIYGLPFASGSRFTVLQSVGGSFSHTQGDFYCVDFDMPEGTPVCAAREGVVVHTENSFRAGGTNSAAFKDQANLVMLQHTDHTIGLYSHLRWNGIAVNVGQYVTRGQLLGYSGNTGYSSGPHLHFGVFLVVSSDPVGQSVPVSFQSREGGIQNRLEVNRAYTAL